MPELLRQELETFEAQRDELVRRVNGKFVLIKGDRVVGTFDTESDAIAAGYKEFGNVAFLVKHVAPSDRPLNFVSGLVSI